jgi:DNA (cytosine-5)-methyltransferase 1
MLAKIRDYPACLEACWQEHLQPRGLDAPTVISTFAGAGGSSLGYSMAGFRELLAAEWDANAVQAFRLNFPEVPVYHGDIARLTAGQVLEMAGLKPGELDVLDGSPPCQEFSTAGKRQLDDPRNQLFREYVRLLRVLRPKVFVMENVSGMVKGVMKLVFAEALRELKASGYRVSARLLNAMYFGVPQSRERMIFTGVREDLGIEPGHPKAWSFPVTVYEALAGCEVGLSDGLFSGERLKVARRITCGGDGSDVRKGMNFNLKRLDGHKPSRPVIKVIGRPNALYGGGLIHPSENRHLGIGELKRINSMPDRFQLTGTFQEQWMRIGNSVPPPVRLPRSVRSAHSALPSSPSSEIPCSLSDCHTLPAIVAPISGTDYHTHVERAVVASVKFL